MIDNYINLWIAVIYRAYKDAIGKIPDVSCNGGRCRINPIWLENRLTAIKHEKVRIQNDALRFLKNEDWIYIITGIDKDYLLKKIKDFLNGEE